MEEMQKKSFIFKEILSKSSTANPSKDLKQLLSNTAKFEKLKNEHVNGANRYELIIKDFGISKLEIPYILTNYKHFISMEVSLSYSDKSLIDY